MYETQTAGHDGRPLRRYEYDDHWVVVADLPVDDDHVDVDLVGSTAILVVDHGDRLSETEFELPGADATATVNNGVLTVRVAK